MSLPILHTKLNIPRPRPRIVVRPRLVARLDEGLQRKLTLVAAPAGFGKTTLLGAWGARHPLPVAWLTLDEDDGDPARFLTYLIAALQTIAPHSGEDLLRLLQGTQPPPTEAVLAALINEIAAFPDSFVLVLDDYHAVDARAVDEALNFLLKHHPAQMHLVVASREDPRLSLARLRARDQLTELRAADLRFTPPEAAEFLNQVMGLNLSGEDVAALENRTEGWIAGLQLAAISLLGQQDPAAFINSFSGSHRFVLDYLLEEVLQRQPTGIQTFLLHTSILDRLCGPLCDAVLRDPSTAGQATLEYLEQANLFIVPLDDERRWYRYHRLFADLLRLRLQQKSATATAGEATGVSRLHIRASEWYEDNGLELEAFHHAAAADDIDRAERLLTGQGMPLHFRGLTTAVQNWLASLPASTLAARPSLAVAYASAQTMTGQPLDSIEAQLLVAEAALQNAAPDERTGDITGQIAAIRAMLAVPGNQLETIIAQSRRALEFLHPDNLALHTTMTWTLGYAYQLQGERAAAVRAYGEALSASQASGNVMISMGAATCMGQIQEAELQLHAAAESYRHVLQLAGDPPWPTACEAHLGLARLYYQWNDLAAAQQHEQQSRRLAAHLANVDTPAACGVLLARLQLARNDNGGATATLAQAERFAQRHNFAHWLPEIASIRVLILLRQGRLQEAASLAEAHELPISQARAHLAQGAPAAAVALLEPLRREMAAKGWHDQQIMVLIVQALALQAQGEEGHAAQLLGEALALAEPGGAIRVFLDEGPLLAALLREAARHGNAADYVRQILAAFGATTAAPSGSQAMIEPLSERELEVLRLLGSELNGPEIAAALAVSLNTLRTHSKSIYGKLNVNNRRAAVRRAEELDLL